MSNTMFRCPNTGMNVQHLATEPLEQNAVGDVTVVHCPACARIHLINAATGELARDAVGGEHEGVGLEGLGQGIAVVAVVHEEGQGGRELLQLAFPVAQARGVHLHI